jgi:fatty acid desaturase
MTGPSASAELEASLSKADYDSLRAELSFTPSAVLSTLTLVVHLGLLALGLHLLMRGDVVSYLAAQLLLPIVFFQAFSLLHDCGHGSFARARGWSTFVGHFASVLCFMPYFPWKYIHTEHHVWAGNVERDPGLALVRRARDTQKLPWLLAAAWRTWLPLGGFAQHIVYWSYPLRARGSGKLQAAQRWRCAASVALLIVAYVGLPLALPSLFTLRNFAPAIFLYLMLVELVNVPHHVGLTGYQDKLPLWKQHLPTRSCNYPPIVSELLVLNFNFHIEHHLFPTLPWYRLRSAHHRVRAKLATNYREARGIDWHVASRRQHLIDVMSVTRPREREGSSELARSENQLQVDARELLSERG